MRFGGPAQPGIPPLVGSTSLFAATRSELRDHWVWRPEWTAEKTCLYWYLTFREDQLVSALGHDVLRAAAGTSWLDDVPPEWCHVTVTDVGFTDELASRDVDRVTEAVADAVTEEDRLRLTLGPVQAFASAVVLAVGPLDRLRAIRSTVRRTVSTVLGSRHADVHRRLFWPHLSLGYVNRSVDADTATRFLAGVPPVQAQVDVDALTLAAVTRRDRGYQWEVQAQVNLLGDAARTT
jgi:2'-5' RNA ligase